MSPVFVDKAEKRKAIAHASVIVFGEKGFDGTKMEDVAKVAGVGKGTLYEYFKNKDELFQGAFLSLFEAMAEETMPLAIEGTPVAETMREVAMGMAHGLMHMGHAYKFFLEYALYEIRKDAGMSEMQDVLIQYRQAYYGLIVEGQERGELRPDVDAAGAAAAIVAWFDGVAFHWMAMPDSTDVEQLTREFIEIMLRGMMMVDSDNRGGV